MKGEVKKGIILVGVVLDNRDILHRKKTDVSSGKLSGQIPGNRFNR